MGPILTCLTSQVAIYSKQPFDWAHARLYPGSTTKLGMHADNEKVICYGSDIYCLTFMPQVGTRDVYIVPKIEKIGEKRKNKQISTGG